MVVVLTIFGPASASWMGEIPRPVFSTGDGIRALSPTIVFGECIADDWRTVGVIEDGCWRPGDDVADWFNPGEYLDDSFLRVESPCVLRYDEYADLSRSEPVSEASALCAS